MPLPYLIHENTSSQASTGAISIPRPTGVLQAGDVEFIFLETANQAVTVPSGWSHAPGSPLGVGTAGSTTATRLTVLWRYSQGETTSISIADPGDHVIGWYMAWRDCDQTSPFWNASTPYVASSSTAQTEDGLGFDPPLAPTVNNLVYLVVAANERDVATVSPPWFYVNFYLDPESYGSNRRLFQTSTGNGGGFALCWEGFADSHQRVCWGFEINSEVAVRYALIGFLLQGNQSNDRSGTAFITANSSSAATASGSNSAKDNCPKLYSYSAKSEGSTAFWVMQPDIRIDGSIINTIQEASGRFELLVVESAAQSVFMDPYYQFQHVPNSPIKYGTAGGTTSVGLSVFWRLAPNNEFGPIYLEGAGEHAVAARFLFDNVDTLSPIIDVSTTNPAPSSWNPANMIDGVYGGSATAERGGNSHAGYGYLVFPSNMCSMLSFIGWAADAATWAHAPLTDPNTGEPIPGTKDIFPPTGPPLGVDTHDLLYPAYEYGTTIGNGGGFHGYISKVYNNTLDKYNPLDWQSTNYIYTQFLGYYEVSRYAVGIWIGLRSLESAPARTGVAQISHISSLEMSHVRSMPEFLTQAIIESTSVVSASYTRSKEAYKEALVSLSHSVLASGEQIQGGFFYEDLISSVTLSVIKKIDTEFLISANSQAVPIARKATQLPASIDLVLDYFNDGYPFFDNEVSNNVILSLESSVVALVAKNSSAAVDFMKVTELSSTYLPRRRTSFSSVLASGFAINAKKNSLVSSAVDCLVLIDPIILRGRWVSVTLALSHLVIPAVRKAATREFYIWTNSSLWATARLVTAFEYGDIIIMDLRASLDSRNLDATRNNLALEVRRGVGTDYERVADNPVIEVRRSLPEEFFGSATKLDGIEIVCVREIFDENK